jgi:hypothetical protein
MSLAALRSYLDSKGVDSQKWWFDVQTAILQVSSQAPSVWQQQAKMRSCYCFTMPHVCGSCRCIAGVAYCTSVKCWVQRGWQSRICITAFVWCRLGGGDRALQLTNTTLHEQQAGHASHLLFGGGGGAGRCGRPTQQCTTAAGGTTLICRHRCCCVVTLSAVVLSMRQQQAYWYTRLRTNCVVTLSAVVCFTWCCCCRPCRRPHR